MRWVADGCEHLRGSNVGPAEHADFAVRIRQRGSPFDGVVAVVGLVFEGIPLALGGVAAAHILHDDEVATRRGGAAKVGCVVLVIGRALQQRRVFAIARGVVDVRTQGDAVAGLHGDAAFDRDVRRLARGR